ncbi:hypothetical protein PISL3812_03510 [Talaromyces islandicus]|uniref:Uncharacterized protein n=1 Tax=Talaromyces islandicus TaxID=28573 RepID=A0A0U1LSZ1_TALIS|nr:hypothetical protein PISL3812_03510 [Talaromyces islandicus]
MASGLFFDPKAALAVTPLVSSTCTLLFAWDQDFFLRLLNIPENRSKSNAILPAYFKLFFSNGMVRIVGFLGVTFWSTVGNYYWRHSALVSNQSLKWYLAGGGLALSHLLFVPLVAPPIRDIINNGRSKKEPTDLLDEWLSINWFRSATVDFAAWACMYRFFIPILTTSLRKPLNQSAVLRRQKNKVPVVFLPIITATKVPLLEGDFNFHKSNSTYFTDLDTSRAHLLAFLCFKGMVKLDKELSADGKKGILTVMLGSTQTSFKREIPTLQPYEVWSRILTWDQKWLYIVTHFVQHGRITPTASVASMKADSGASKSKTPLASKDVESSIFATSISKCVFKKGRMTVSPERILRASDLLSPVSSSDATINLSKPTENHMNGGAASSVADKIPSTTQDDSQLLAEIEAERVKGIKYADFLSGLEELQGQLLKDDEVSNGVVSLGTFNDLGRLISA